MFNFNDAELKRYRTDALFRNSMECAMKLGLTKEDALSRMCLLLLQMRDEENEKKLDAAMKCSSLSLFLGK